MGRNDISFGSDETAAIHRFEIWKSEQSGSPPAGDVTLEWSDDGKRSLFRSDAPMPHDGGAIVASDLIDHGKRIRKLKGHGGITSLKLSADYVRAYFRNLILADREAAARELNLKGLRYYRDDATPTMRTPLTEIGELYISRKRGTITAARCNSHPIGPAASAALTAAPVLTAAQPAAAQPGWALSHQKISHTEGGFKGILDDSDFFGVSIVTLGDLDGDGVVDLAVGAYQDDDGGANRGAVYVLFLNPDGTVKSEQKISDTAGGFTGNLNDSDGFGDAVASLGDLDGDGVGDLAVGAYADDDGGSNVGAVWILFLNSDGTVKAHQKISRTQGGFGGMPSGGSPFGNFGVQVDSLGDLDGDGVTDLAVGAFFEDDGGSDVGAVWILFLNVDGTVKSHQKISSSHGGFTGPLDDGDRFGVDMAWLGDLDGDGVGDLAVGAHNDGDGGFRRGAVWVLFLQCNPCDMNCDGSVDAGDIEVFIDLLFNGVTPCGTCAGDANGDGRIDAADIESFINCLFP